MKKSCIRYYGGKLLAFVVSVLVRSVLVFYIARLAPGDPLVSYYGDRVEKMSVAERAWAEEKLGLSAESFNHSDEKVTYHASCHLCRGLGVKEAPRELIAAAADYVPAAEEEVCCGFGGTYSAKFPEVSAALLRKKLDGIADTGAARVVMDCPGCVLQIRGGAEKDGKGLKVTHISELLAENLKK